MGAVERYLPQQVRIDLVLRCLGTTPGPWIDRFKPHQAHQPLDPLAVDRMALTLPPRRHPAATLEGRAQILFIHPSH